MISATIPEPTIDIAAQIAAMLDDVHPKKAVWVSAGSGCGDVPRGIYHLPLFSGELLARDADDCDRLSDDPSDETLAAILGYVEPKSAIVGRPIVVQARRDKAVVFDMACSLCRVTEAIEIAQRHGKVVLTTPKWALLRRLALWNAERGI